MFSRVHSNKGFVVPKSSSSLLKRRLEIADIVRKHGEVKVDDLSLQLGVSGVTIRNDLNYLEQQGYLKRSFGGAIYTPQSNAQSANQQIIDEPLRIQLSNKTIELELAKQCARLAQDRDVLFIGHGDLMRKTIPFLAERKKIRLIVNDLAHAWLAKDFIDGEVVVTGGVLGSEPLTLCGELAVETLKQSPDVRCLIMVDAISAEGDLCLYNPELAATYRDIMQNSQYCMVMIAQRPCGKEDAIEIGRLTDVGALIAPQVVIAEYHHQLMKAGLTNSYTNNECLTYLNPISPHVK